MNKVDVTNKMTRTFYKTKLQVTKHSPEILAVAGVIGVVASTVMACKATRKIDIILEETKEITEQIHETSENPMFQDRYSKEDAKRDLTIAYVQTGIKVARLYAPAVAVGTLGLGCLLQSNNILRKRNIALAAAYATVEKGFKEYRSRVVDRFGETVDKELRYNMKAQEVEETVVDEETGKKKKVKKTQFVGNPSDITPYARTFEKYIKKVGDEWVTNPFWNDASNEYNMMFIKNQERYANDLLKARGYLFLNTVYELLGLPISQEGNVVGWIYDKNNPVGDNFVDFGIYADSCANYSDFINGVDDYILLDFNVDGNILDLI